MATQLVHPDRVRRLDDGSREPDGAGDFVLYWMQRACRAEHNDALEHAVRTANDHGVPLHVVFGLTADYPQASGRHYRFLLEGLAEVAGALGRRGIPFAVRQGHPPEVATAAADRAVEVVVDRGYLRHLVAWRRELVKALDVPVTQVEADVVVPVEVASDKREYAARTLRPKLHRTMEQFVDELSTTPLEHTGPPLQGLDLDDVAAVLEQLGLDDDRPGVLTGGTSQARAHLERFLADGLAGYGERRPDPTAPRAVSYQSAYLHHGQVSPVWLVLQARAAGADGAATADVDAWIEELVVRRELAYNYVTFEPDYDAYAALPAWARTTLDEHRDDEREHVYSHEQLRDGRTHDAAWNAAQAQVRDEGYLHNHLRMYWGKQVVKWSASPEEAFDNLLRLNNEHLLDGRDAASYANVAWVFGLHDRAWQETDVAGKTRPMTRSGLDSKLTRTLLRAWLDEVRRRTGRELAGE